MTAQYSPGYLEGMLANRVLLGRVGHPREFAATVLFLASAAGADSGDWRRRSWSTAAR